MNLSRLCNRIRRPGQTAVMATGMVMIALGAGRIAHAQTPADASAPSDVSSPTTDLLAQTIARSLSAMQQSALALTTPQFGIGQPLSLTGNVYFVGGNGSPLIDQKVTYANGGMALNVGYRSVSQNIVDADLLGYRTGKDASLPDALSQLIAQRGQNDLNAELGLTGLHGLKFDYKIDTQTNALTKNQATNQSLLFEKDSHASVFSFLHSVASTGATSGAGQTMGTDELKYAYTPTSGLSLTGDASTSQGAGKDSSQWRLGLGEKLDHLNFGGEFWASDTQTNTAGQNARQDGEKFKIDGQVAPAVTVTGFYDHEMIASDQTQAKEEFDATIKSAQTHNLELMAEFSRAQQMAQAAQAKQRLQAIWSLPHFIGVTSAKWVIGLTDQTMTDQALRRDVSIGFESQVPGRVAALPGLSGATLQLEYAGNSIGATPTGVTTNTPSRPHATLRHSRLLRLVSAPQASKLLTWSIAQQTRVSDQGTMLPAMRDYEIKGVISPSVSLAYSDRDQLPQDDGTMRDTKAQTLSVTVSQPHSAQIVAAFVHGADMSNGISGQNSVSVGLTSSAGSDQTMSLSLGRDRRTKVGGSPITGTTCKTAFDWRQDAKNLLGFNGTLTAWDHSGDAKTDSIDAAANLHFERVY